MRCSRLKNFVRQVHGGSLATALLLLASASAHAHDRSSFEVWLVDQSNTNGLSYGGTVYIYDGRSVTTKLAPDVGPEHRIDLGAATAELCLASTGALPVRPHMLVFNSTDTHAVLTFVASGHVVILDARRRTPLACFRTEPGVGAARQAHAAWPTADDRYVLVANQNGKKLERIRTNYARNVFAQEPAATLDLANCTTPNGLPCEAAGLRPDNAPICPFVASDNGPAFVSLRGGGMFVIDWRTMPMSIVSEYDVQNVPPNGCGFIRAREWIFANGGGGTAANLDQFTVYRVPMEGHCTGGPPNDPTVQVLFNDDAPERDAHGVAVTRHERFVWVGDRDANVAEVFESETGARLTTVDLTSAFSSDPTPDLFAASPDQQWLFASTRGPNPLSGDPHSSTGKDPGLLVIRLRYGGWSGEVHGLLPITNVDSGGVERADAHGIRVRRVHGGRHRETR
jgi:hypothetical protein